MELESKEVRLLAEIGLLAVGDGRWLDAQTIAGAVDAARPGDVSVFVIRAMIELGNQKPDVAIKLLREDGLIRHPDSQLLRAFLGMALQSAGYRAQSEEILAQVSTNVTDEKAAALARALLSPGEAPKGPVEGLT